MHRRTLAREVACSNIVFFRHCLQFVVQCVCGVEANLFHGQAFRLTILDEDLAADF